MNATYTTKPCMLCGESSELTMNPEDWNRWASGELIQDVWPDKSSYWRELVITGTHPECWQQLFGDDELCMGCGDVLYHEGWHDDGNSYTCPLCGWQNF